MIVSMTGFGSAEETIFLLGRISVEIRSVNHKFLEVVSHLPAGFLSLEERVKKEIEAKVKRGRVTCVIGVAEPQASKVFINKKLIKDYIVALKNIQRQFGVEGRVNTDVIIHLPGVISLSENSIPAERVWPKLKVTLDEAILELVRMRSKEGKALQAYLKIRAQALKKDLGIVKSRFKKVVGSKIAQCVNDEERSGFLKDTDITEEVERLDFHIRNFTHKLSGGGAVGKELDFIAQEMQREANTMGAKSCDAFISARVIQMKSQVEKIREQVQNIE